VIKYPILPTSFPLAILIPGEGPSKCIWGGLTDMEMWCSAVCLSGGDWEIHSDPEREGCNGIMARADGWIRAKVPGNIQADLEDAALLSPIRYGAGEDKLFDVAMTDWWYRKDFTAPFLKPGARYTLVFDGVDYGCDVYLNGKWLGRNEGMFLRFEMDATAALLPGVLNTLAVKIDRMPEELLEDLKLSDGKQSGVGTEHFFVEVNNRIRRRLKGLKSPANLSYDWGTNIYTLGIWKDVRLEVTGPARIRWLKLDAQPDESGETAMVHVRLELEGGADDMTAEVEIEGETHALAVENGVAEGYVKLHSPRLWWPAGIGSQPLYRATARVFAAGMLSDEKSDRFGVRDIRWELCEGAPEGFENKFQLYVNNVPVRTMGSNFVAPDLLFGRCGPKCRRYVELARACHMNTLRQHGGQVIFSREFYDAADELGILLLVDFPIGNCVLESDEEFLKNLSATVGNIVLQLCNHPSIVEWSGGNELNYHFDKDADRTGLDVERAAVAAADDTRVFRDTCPVSGSRHAPWDYNPDIHYKYYNSALTDNFGVVPMMRYGEFGCQTPANIETWYSDFPAASRWPINCDDAVQIRKNAVNGCFDNDVWFSLGHIERLFGKMDGIDEAVRAGQFLAAEGIRYAMDALRAKGRHVAGFTNWDYNEPWPNGAGSFLVDYDGRPVMAYHFARQALESVALQLRYDHILYNFFDGMTAELLLVSDAPAPLQGLRWRCRTLDREGNVYGEYEGEASITHLETMSLASISIAPPQKMLAGPVTAELSLRGADGSLLAERMYLFGASGAQAPLRGVLHDDAPKHGYDVPYVTTGMYGGAVKRVPLRISGTAYEHGDGIETFRLTLMNDGDATAYFVEVRPMLQDRGDLFIDNDFAFIPAGESRTITVCVEAHGALTLAQTGWRLFCWNAETQLTIEPSADVVLWMGRSDRTCHGYANQDDRLMITARGRELPCGEVPALVQTAQTFRFDCAEPGAPLRLSIHTADRGEFGSRVRITLNGHITEVTLPKGLGVQMRDPEHLAVPASVDVQIPSGVVRQECNELIVQPLYGWFTWDSMTVTSH
jgi:beta-mannosidase